MSSPDVFFYDKRPRWVGFLAIGITTDLAASQSLVGKWGLSTERVMDRLCSKAVQKQAVLMYACDPGTFKVEASRP